MDHCKPRRRLQVLLQHMGSPDALCKGVAPVATGVQQGLFGKVKMTFRHGGELVAQTLKAHGVEFVFTLAGGHISPILTAGEALGIRIVDFRHEANAAFAADAVGRLTGRPGVAAVTAGPGVTNSVTAVRNAALASSPMLLIGGAAATMLQGRGSLQDVEQLEVLKAACKKVHRVTNVRDIVAGVRESLQAACSGVPGPVFLELPIDILYNVFEAQAGAGMIARRTRKALTTEEVNKVIVPEEKKGMTSAAYVESLAPDAPCFLPGGANKKVPAVARAYIDYKIKDIFADVNFDGFDFSPLPLDVPVMSPGDFGKCLDMLQNAKKPLIVLGSQCMLGAAHDRGLSLQKALMSLGFPCYLGGMSRGLLGKEHSILFRQNRGAALNQADVIILAGAVTDFRLDYGRSLGKAAQIIACNRSQDELNLNHGLTGFWKGTVRAKADPCDFLERLAKAFKQKHSLEPWLGELRAREAAKEASNAEGAAAKAYGRDALADTELLNPLALTGLIEKVLPDNAVLVGDGGDFVATAAYTVRPRGPFGWMDPGAFGTLGCGAGFAIASALVFPDRETWILWGDGAAGYGIAEIDTMERFGCGVICLIGNDACWSQIEREQIPMLGSGVSCPLKYREYHEVSRGYGGEGLLIGAENISEAESVLAEARKIAAAKKPIVVNALIGKSSFREGSISV
eukprot:gnl/MRDRNA2_/MRDRNA2_106362_c0_seq1.p1 gnl/MRDRNA2_/MRDRNA2_106362_c0~~gnl/MRDRNA2_/MRDRNA2_106362_c0_seq1.p1  ORF type:complete len:705 (+),score=130.74 gnl/MRDRNA2_/MRDRNA2_106362_c0_seq1:66-2117(+)